MENQLNYIALQTENSPALYFQTKHFLKLAQQKNWQKEDEVFIAMHASKVIGYARFVALPESGDLWLRGLFVLSQYRRQGIAANLLQFAHHYLASNKHEFDSVICFPLEHLDNFYRRLGYQTVQLENLPSEIQQRYRQAEQDGKHWLLMQKSL